MHTTRFVTLTLAAGLLAAVPLGSAAAQRAVARPAPAPGATSLRLGLVGGLSLPGGDLGHAADAGAALGVRAEGPLRPARWSVRGDLAFDRFGGRGGVDAYSFASLAGSLVHREGVGRFYEYGGLGVYHARTSFVDALTRSDTNLGVQFGIGATFTSRAPRWFAEAGFTSAFTSGRSSIWFPVRVGFWL